MAPQWILRTEVVALFSCGVVLGLACESDDECPVGQEGCPCADDGLCLEGLSCLSSYCVDPDWTPPADTTPADDGDDDGSGGDDGGTFDNVGACNALVDELVCGDADLGMYIDCGLYGATPCDLADYFNCVRENVSCTDGFFDTTQLTACVDLATCA